MSLDSLIGKIKSEFQHNREERARAEAHNLQAKIEEKPAEPQPAPEVQPEQPAAEAPAEAAPEAEKPQE